MAVKKAIKAIDQVMDDLRSVTDELHREFQSLRYDMNIGFIFLDRRLSSVEQQLESHSEQMESTSKSGIRFFDFIFNIAFLTLGISIANFLIHIN